MSDKQKAFLDTNILIYRSFGSTAQKEKIQDLLIQHQGNICISAQVLNEYINTSVKKKFFESEFQLTEAVNHFVNNFHVSQVSSSTVLKANYLRNKYKLAHYDSVIVASALESKCEILYTEDLHHHLIIEKRIEIINPFK